MMWNAWIGTVILDPSKFVGYCVWRSGLGLAARRVGSVIQAAIAAGIAQYLREHQPQPGLPGPPGLQGTSRFQCQ
jgi:hypothetical protein